MNRVVASLPLFAFLLFVAIPSVTLSDTEEDSLTRYVHAPGVMSKRTRMRCVEALRKMHKHHAMHGVSAFDISMDNVEEWGPVRLFFTSRQSNRMQAEVILITLLAEEAMRLRAFLLSRPAADAPPDLSFFTRARVLPPGSGTFGDERDIYVRAMFDVIEMIAILQDQLGLDEPPIEVIMPYRGGRKALEARLSQSLHMLAERAAGAKEQ